MVNQTRLLIERTLIELCKVKPFDRIRVRDICETACISRQTFYNHYKDKYELVASIFSQDINTSFEPGCDTYSYDLMLNSLKMLWSRREFYCDVLNSGGQNSLYAFSIQHMVRIAENIIHKHYNKPMNAEQTYQVFYSVYGCIGCINEWLLGNLHYTPEELARIQIASFPAFMIESYD